MADAKQCDRCEGFYIPNKVKTSSQCTDRVNNTTWSYDITLTFTRKSQSGIEFQTQTIPDLCQACISWVVGKLANDLYKVPEEK